MSCNDCEIIETMKALQSLFSKLEKVKFSGKLRLTFEGGKVSSAELRHYLPFSELGRELPTVEPGEEFSRA